MILRCPKPYCRGVVFEEDERFACNLCPSVWWKRSPPNVTAEHYADAHAASDAQPPRGRPPKLRREA